MGKIVFLCFWVACGLSARAAYEWTHVGADDRLGGRMISAGYLRGKVVVLDRRDYGDVSKENREDILRLQTLWATYKTKPFIVLGGHTGGSSAKRVRAVLKKLGVTYPVYAGADLADSDALGTPSKGEDALERHAHLSVKDAEEAKILVVDSTCRRRLYRGNDPRAVGGVAGSALMSASVPATARQYGFLLDYEIENLPGRAYLRLKEFRAKFPEEAAAYDAAWESLSKSADVRRVAKLGELSRLVKDRNTADPSARRLTPEILEKTIEKYEDLKAHANPYLAQEAKNALADIKWASATL